MSVNQDSQVDQIWSKLNQQQQQEVVNQFRTVIKEMISEHFRFDSNSAPLKTSENLHPSVQPQSSAHQLREPTNAVRVA